MPLSLKQLGPLRVIIGQEDVTHYVDDGLSFSSVDPGGFEACSLAFPRDLPQTLRGQYIRIDSGLRVAWEGRVGQIQRSLGHRTTVNGEGYGALLTDNTASMVFVDRDLTKWTDPSYTRQLALLTGNLQLQSSAVAADPTSLTPALVQAIQNSWTSPWTPTNESWYDSGPKNLIAQIYYNLSLSEAAIGAWNESLELSSDANRSVFESSGNQHGSAPTSGYFAPATAYRFALLRHNNSTTAIGAQGANYSAYWQQLAVYGNHGLTGRGSDPVGFYPSDIYNWVISQVLGLAPGIIVATDASNYIVPHSVYYTPVTLDTMVSDMATAQGWHWGVWESLSPLTGNATPRADFRPRPTAGAFTAFLRREDCDTLDIREDLSQQYNAATVNYTDVAGVPGSVTLTADNPILDQAGISSRTVIFQAGTMTAATAQIFGLEALAILNSQQRVAGSIDVISPVQAPGPMPAWLLKPGIDRVRIGDLPSTDAWGAQNDVPLTRMECSVSSSGMNTNLEIGSGASLVETLQSRIAAATALAAQGGA